MPVYSHVSPLRKQDVWARRSFLTDFQIYGRFLKLVAAQQGRSQVRDFGTVFNFPLPLGDLRFLMIEPDPP